MLQCKVPTTMRGMGWESETGSKTGGETGGETGGKGSETGGKTGGEMGWNEIILGFRVPTTCGKKTLITTYSGEVSPPPANRTTIPYTFTELQKAFVGPHHGPEILGQKQPIDH